MDALSAGRLQDMFRWMPWTCLDLAQLSCEDQHNQPYPSYYNLYNSLFYTADSLDKDFASEYTGRGSRASKIDVTESHHRQDSGQAPSKL
jgi:hypothetical protein